MSETAFHNRHFKILKSSVAKLTLNAFRYYHFDFPPLNKNIFSKIYPDILTMHSGQDN